MAICNFFLQNRCKFGDRCRFEHPRGGAQRNLFSGPSQPWQGGSGGNTWQGGGGGSGSNNWQGGGGGNTWQGGGHGSGGNTWQGGGGGSGSNNWQSGGGGNTWQGGGGGGGGGSNNWQSGGGGNTWQGGGGGGGNAWQGGSSGQRVTFKDSFATGGQASGGQRQQGPQGSDQQSSTLDLINSLPKEMELWEKSHMWPFSCFSVDKDISSLPEFNDLSPEELRIEAYQAIESGNILPYTQKVQSLQNEFQGKRRQLQHMTMDLKSKLMAVIDEARKKAQTQPVSASSSVFGSSQASQNAFGQTQASTTSAGLFGRSAAAPADGNSSNLFGKSTSGSVFGGNLSPRPDNSSSFASSGASLFGKPVTAGSVFGNQPQAQAAQAANPFGPVNDSSSPKTSGLFGQAASSGPQTNTLFGQAGNSPVNPSTRLFGGSAASQSPGLFGKSFPQQSANASFPVGTGSPATQTGPLFGTSANQNQPPASLFGKPNPGHASTAPSMFGGVASNQGQDNRNVPALSAASVFGGSAPASTAIHGLYTPLADLTEQEKEEFSAKTFTLGKIPIRPPPREMVN